MKLITFDFWNTLFLDQHEGIRHHKRIAFALDVFTKYRSFLRMDEVETAFQSAHKEYLQQWDNRKAFTMDRHVRHIVQYLNIDARQEDVDSVVDFFECILLQHPPSLIKNAIEAVQFGSSKMKVGLISDTGYSPGRTLRKLLASHNIENSFHAFSFSNETGFLKPNAQCFRTILDQFQIAPEDAVHVGDLEETDIAGAKQIGMQAIKYIGANPSATLDSLADHVIDDLSELQQLV